MATVNSVRTPIRAAAVALFVTLALVAAACGGTSSTETSSTPASGDTGSGDGGQDDATPAPSGVTAIEVLDVETGDTTTIADTVTGDRPVLLWFWAPH